MLDFQPVEFGHVMDVTQVLGAWIMCGHTENLVIGAHFVGHLEHAEDPGGDKAAGESWFFEQHQGVKRVTVSAEGLLDEPVIGRVPGRGEQHAVKAHPAGVVVDLVLVPLALGDLDDYLDVHALSPVGCLLSTPLSPVTATLSYAHRNPRKVGSCAVPASRPSSRSRC